VQAGNGHPPDIQSTSGGQSHFIFWII